MSAHRDRSLLEAFVFLVIGFVFGLFVGVFDRLASWNRESEPHGSMSGAATEQPWSTGGDREPGRSDTERRIR